MKFLNLKKSIYFLIIIFALSSCKSLPGGDATKNPPNARDRVAKILKKVQIINSNERYE